MKKLLKSKGFLVTALSVSCIAILAACWLVGRDVTVLKNYPYIGLMGYCAGENPLSYPETDYQMVLQLISSAKKLVDYVILDCGSAMTNVFTPAAIESGDLVLRIVTPDLKGINYLKAHQPLLVDGRFHYHEHMTFAGMARPFHAFDEMGYIIGGFDGLLPYGKEIDRCATEGGMFQAIKYCNSKCPDRKSRFRPASKLRLYRHQQ